MEVPMTVAAGSGTEASLVCREQRLRLALPLAHVVEVMRPLAVQAMPGLPPFVRGATVIRGDPVPVVDAAGLLAVVDSAPSDRWVVLRAGSRRIALAVEAVEGIRDLAAATTVALPPLLRHGRAEAMSSIGSLDVELLVVLRAASVLTDGEWLAFTERCAAP
jgi:purine-binding chemotaxis protein CheW